MFVLTEDADGNVVGASGSKAKPYMIPAFEKEIPNFIKELSNALDKD